MSENEEATKIKILCDRKIAETEKTISERVSIEVAKWQSEYDRDYSIRVSKHNAIFASKVGAIIALGIITIVSAFVHTITTQFFWSDFVDFWAFIWSGVVALWGWSVSVATLASQGIQIKWLSVLVYGLICFLLTALPLGGIGVGLFFGGRYVYDYEWDKITLYVVACSLLVISFLGDFIHIALPLNVFALWVVGVVGYFVGRGLYIHFSD